MRPFQIFAGMPRERAHSLLEKVAEKSQGAFDQALLAASAALKSRPQYLMKQPFERRANAVRQVLSRVGSDALAEEILAVYFLECRAELVSEWLDLMGLEHEDGALKEDSPPEPPEPKLRTAVESFRAGGDDPDRTLFLRAFAAQSSITWPALDGLLDS